MKDPEATIGKKIKRLRMMRGLTAQELADGLSEICPSENFSRSKISKWETGVYTPMLYSAYCIARYFNVSVDYLISDATDNVNDKGVYEMQQAKGNMVPVVGTIAAGEPILAEEHIEEFILVDPSSSADFGLRVKGDSMINAHILDGDIALIRQQETLETGEIGAILIGNEATLKTFRKTENMITLYPENTSYDPITIVNGEDSYHDNDVRILGKYVGLFRNKEE